MSYPRSLNGGVGGEQGDVGHSEHIAGHELVVLYKAVQPA